MASVYVLRFPDGKYYIGMTNISPEKRWASGLGYKSQPKIWDAIEKYGWNSINKITFEVKDLSEAEKLESFLIATLDTIENGYNSVKGEYQFEDNYKVILGNLIKQYRKHKGLSQQELAESIGYKGKDMISRIESGQVSISFNRVMDIIEYLEINVGDFNALLFNGN